ncbi:MAG: TonB-dependent receptor [Gammaproteobacteria bacterium]|nr:TonB-dependent receptor [Gammaproteobacteria bacterium]
MNERFTCPPRVAHHTWLLLALAAGAPQVQAQATAQGASDTHQGTVSSMIEEITVTARKREESLDDLPLSVTAFTGEGLEARGVGEIGELGRLTPNITFQNNPSFGGSGNVASVYIRGIGAKEFTPTTDPGVGIYVDGVYIARSVGGILALLDFERIELLRGPQGTLFGRNTIGGAISITTVRPADEFDARLALTTGSGDRIDLKGSLNLPVNERLFAKVTLATFNQDGYVKRTDGVKLGEDDTDAARIDLRWLASDRFTVDWSFDWSEDRETGPALSLIDMRFGPATIDPSTPPFVFFNNVAATLGGSVPNPLPPGPPPPECATASAPQSSNPLCYDRRYVTGPNGPNAGTAPAFSNAIIWGTSLHATWDLNDAIELRSITAWRDLESKFSRDGDHSPLRITQFYDDLKQQQFSQELQLLGTHFDQRLHWILGFYYFTEDGYNTNLLDFLISSFRSGGDYDNRSTAVFAQTTFDINSRLHLTGGLRWTRDRKQFLPDQEIYTLNPATAGFLSPPQQFIFQPGTPILPAVEKTLRKRELSPLVNLSFDWTDNLLGYVSYTEGYKSGGFTQRVLPPLVPGLTCPTAPLDCIPGFDPEFATVYEVGFRYASADGRMRLSGAGYLTDYKDLQISVFTSVAPVYRNAAGASIGGFEFEGRFTPDDLTFFEAGIGYTDAEYDQIDPSTRVAIGNKLERISKWSLNAALARDLYLGQWLLTPRLDWSYRSRLYNDAFNSPQLTQPGYHLLDLAFALRSPDTKYTITAGINNLTDKTYLVSGVFGDAFSSYEGLYDRGRQWFLRLDWRY